VLARRIDGMGTCAEIRVTNNIKYQKRYEVGESKHNTKVGREVARLAKEESRLIPEPNDVSVETRKGLQMYGCMTIVICMYFLVCM
jgi:hypothetical protein